MNRRWIVAAAVLAVIVTLGLVSLALRSGDDDEPALGPDPEATTTTTSTTSTTTTTTIAPEDIEPLDDEALDIDREFSADSQAESTGPIGSTETTIPTDEGEVSIGGGEVPELVEDFPLPDGYEIQLASEVPGEVGFSGRIDGELADLVAFFDAELAAAGYEIVARQEVPGVLTVLTVDGPFEGDVVISEEPGGDGWTLVVALAEPAG